MTQFLLFQLYGPLQSYGDIAVGEMRPGFHHPGKSALLGLIGACLGIKRNEDNALANLHKSYGFAVRIDSEGVPLRDYHTVQMPKAKKGRVFFIRQEEVKNLEAGETLNSLPSYRDYCQDALFAICLWAKADPPPHSLEQIKEKMKNPVFVPYLGRKSCTLALPFKPLIITCDSIYEAFTSFKPDRAFLSSVLDLESQDVRVYWEEGIEAGLSAHHRLLRRDQPLRRRTWQFQDRTEYQGTIRLP